MKRKMKLQQKVDLGEVFPRLGEDVLFLGGGIRIGSLEAGRVSVVVGNVHFRGSCEDDRSIQVVVDGCSRVRLLHSIDKDILDTRFGRTHSDRTRFDRIHSGHSRVDRIH